MDQKRIWNIASGLLIVGFLLTVTFNILSQGSVIEGMLTENSENTELCFFDSVFEMGKASISGINITELPNISPFAALIYFGISLAVPVDIRILWNDLGYENIIGTINDLRINQYTLVLYINIVIFMVLLCFSLLVFYLHEEYKNVIFFAAGIILTYPMIYAFEQGELFPLGFCMLLYFYENSGSDSKIRRHMSVICLSIAIALKPELIFFVLILFFEKKYILFFKTFLYCGIITTGSSLILEKKMLENYIKNILLASLNWNPEGLSFINMAGTLYEARGSNGNFAAVQVAGINIVLVILGCILGKRACEQWKKYLIICEMTILIFPLSNISYLLLFVLPMIMLIKKPICKKTDLVYIAFILGSIVLLPIPAMNIKIMNISLTFRLISEIVLVLVLSAFTMIETLRDLEIIKRFRNKSVI